MVTKGSFSYGDCHDYNGDGYYISCYSSTGTYQATQTPSGNYIYRQNGTYTETFSAGGGVVYQIADSYKNQSAETQNNLEFHGGYTNSFTYDGVTYCVSGKYHYTNGQIQYDKATAC